MSLFCNRLRLIGLFAVLALCLPMVGEGQSINYAPTPRSTVLCVSSTEATTAGTGEEIIGTCTIPANTLHTDNMVLRFVFFGKHIANTNSVTLRVRLGGIAGTTILGSVYSTSNIGYVGQGWIVRKTQTTQITGVVAVAATTATAALPTATTVDLATSTTLVFTATTGTAAGDFVLQGFLVEVLS